MYPRAKSSYGRRNSIAEIGRKSNIEVMKHSSYDAIVIMPAMRSKEDSLEQREMY
jgi:hypothetical protein